MALPAGCARCTGSGSRSEPESGPTLDIDPLSHSRQKAGSMLKVSDDDDEPALDSGSDSDSDTPLPLSLVQRKNAKSSGGTGISTFLPSFSVGYIPGAGDLDPEDELEAVKGKSGG